MTTTPDKLSLEIRHRIAFDVDNSDYVVIENFSGQPEVRWHVPTRAVADKLVADRKAMLLQMVSDISDTAKAAVEDARHIDNMKAGRA